MDIGREGSFNSGDNIQLTPLFEISYGGEMVSTQDVSSMKLGTDMPEADVVIPIAVAMELNGLILSMHQKIVSMESNMSSMAISIQSIKESIESRNKEGWFRRMIRRIFKC